MTNRFKELKATISGELEEAINSIFIKHQEELGIADGYVGLSNEILIGDLEEKTADLIADILVTQIQLGREEY